MQGINPITGLCTYSTPCGWCAKWDKKCDKKIGCDTTLTQAAKKRIDNDPLIPTCSNCVHFTSISSNCIDCDIPRYKNFKAKESWYDQP